MDRARLSAEGETRPRVAENRASAARFFPAKSRAAWSYGRLSTRTRLGLACAEHLFGEAARAEPYLDGHRTGHDGSVIQFAAVEHGVVMQARPGRVVPPESESGAHGL
jgi:hypothetical protein